MKAQGPRDHESHNVARPSVNISFPDRGGESVEVDVSEPFLHSAFLICPTPTVSEKRVGRIAL